MSILFIMVIAAIMVSLEEAFGKVIKWVLRPRFKLTRPRQYKFN